MKKESKKQHVLQNINVRYDLAKQIINSKLESHIRKKAQKHNRKVLKRNKLSQEEYTFTPTEVVIDAKSQKVKQIKFKINRKHDL